jgi:hypothetical protein
MQRRTEVMDHEVVQVEGVQKIGAVLAAATRGLAAAAAVTVVMLASRKASRQQILETACQGRS